MGTGRIALLGAGKIGEALIAGMMKAGTARPEEIWATGRRGDKIARLSEAYGVRCGTQNREAVRQANLIILAVKPQNVRDVLEEVREDLPREALLISVAASVGTAYIEKVVGEGRSVIRAMPNTPCLLREGMTVLSPGKHATEAHLETARQIFQSVGRVLVLEEKFMDAVTGLSASGPAYIYLILESLAEGGVKVGLSRGVAMELAAQTTVGAAKMVLETGEHPALLKDAVTTPAGCTIDGLLELEEGGLRVTLIKAVVKAAQRASQLFQG
ncbi:MAG: pyrroline-5-carboxylate reductase [Acidobacteria bacterium]|nr:pyrroline-5-carboxylate reductase [Acidobacteriota bacterium]